uniref:Caspase 8 associated protein 2 n=1 Tax=Sphaeramia orbicularis TaxID=375764 RepID=A0A673BHE8_9TELE
MSCKLFSSVNPLLFFTSLPATPPAFHLISPVLLFLFFFFYQSLHVFAGYPSGTRPSAGLCSAVFSIVVNGGTVGLYTGRMLLWTVGCLVKRQTDQMQKAIKLYAHLLQNTGLNRENCHLKKNISALLQTARLEVTRKDAEIQRSERGRHYHHQSRINNLRDQSSSVCNSKHSSTSTNCQPPPAPPSVPPPPLPPPPLPPLPTLPPREDCQYRDPPVPSKKRTDQAGDNKARTSKPTSHTKSSSRGDVPDKQTEHTTSKSSISSSAQRSESDQQPKHKEEKYQSESTGRRHRTGSQKWISDPSKDHPEKKRSHKDSEWKYDSKSSKSRNYHTVEDKLRKATPDSEPSSKDGYNREHRKNWSSERHSRGSDSKDHKKSERHKHSRERDGNKLSKDCSFKEERQRKEETNRSRKRSISSEMSKDKQRSKESFHGKERHKSLRSPSKEQNVSGGEDSPNRKLCFMETLNLTLSPIKKPTCPFEAGQDDPKAHDNGPEGDIFQPNIEDMCVIDEVDSNTSRGRTYEKYDDEKVLTEKVTVNLTPKLAEGNSPKTTDKDFSPTHKGKTKQTVESRLLVTEEDTSSSSEKITCTDQSVSGTDSSVFKTNIESPKTSVDSPIEDLTASHSQVSVIGHLRKKDKSEIPQTCSTVLQGTSLLPPSSPPSKTDVCRMQDISKNADNVSSTINLESLPQEGLSLPEAIYILTHSNEDVSSTTEEMPIENKGEKYSHLTLTPKKNFSPRKHHEWNVEPSSSVPLLHDEDSMMRTLSNLKRIPDAISPLRSPVRVAKRSLTAVDATSKTVDVNKENKYPGSPPKHDTQHLMDKVSDLLSTPSDTELEEGEIVSESDEAAAASPVPATMRVKLVRPVRNKASPKPLLKRKSEEESVPSKEAKDTAGVSTRSPAMKSRFKTVCPAESKASFTSIEDVMETFKLVRAEIRKKYMKLHKTFPKKSFYGVMENFQESFLEFVDGADLGQICCKSGDLKGKLKKMIASVFSKVLNNGIVKRIFEQQAVDLKQKLWDFVDVQVDYLLRDVYATLKSLCKPTRVPVEYRKSTEISRQQQKDVHCAPASLNRIKPCAVVPYKTGLGSRGKDIRMTNMEKDQTVDPNPLTSPNRNAALTLVPPKNVLGTPDKSNSCSLVVSHNGSLLDKTDFELLTEQQASSLTFNLVRDSQMGEIFKCLLQGSDLLESNVISGDHTAWSLNTPRKDGERLISITTPAKFDSPSKLLSPNKFDTPSKLITTWSSISPRKVSFPRSKDQVQLNPAFFDESCLLEVPSESRSVLGAQRSFSILAEDLAVSLTIPSPLKSDSHLSFLQPQSMHFMSTPDSVISAHFSEDALLDGEDATEYDIHLALDTDNSSCDSSSITSETVDTPFPFKPDLPMQALVMEKSNDHFIVKIRQAAGSADTTLIANESLSRTLTEEDQHCEGEGMDSTSPCIVKPPDNSVNSAMFQRHLSPTKGSADKVLLTHRITSKDVFSEEAQKLSKSPQTWDNTGHNVGRSSNHLFVLSQANTEEGIATERQTCHKEKDEANQESPSKAIVSECQKRISPCKSALADYSVHATAECFEIPQKSQTLALQTFDSERDEMEVTDSDTNLIIAEERTENDQRDGDRKRKRNQVKSKAKRSRKDKNNSTEEMVSNSSQDNCDILSSPSLSPNSLSAKNVIRRKGEVVVAWTRSVSTSTEDKLMSRISSSINVKKNSFAKAIAMFSWFVLFTYSTFLFQGNKETLPC